MLMGIPQLIVFSVAKIVAFVSAIVFLDQFFIRLRKHK